MNKLTTSLLVLFCLATAPELAGADDRDGSRYGFAPGGSLEWRLGAFRGGSRGYEILYRNNRGNRWQLAPGAATALADGWVLGTDRHNGGFGIWRWNGRDWSRMPGSAVRIGGSYHQPWVINNRGVRYVWNGFDWRQEGYGGRGDNRYNARPNDRRDNDWNRGRGRGDNGHGNDRDDDRDRDRDRDRGERGRNWR